MSPGVVYPGILQRLCKEPLAEVTCVQLRGRGIIRLEQLDSCPKLTSLDVSWNSLKQLDGAGLEGCKELWSIDASHNQLETLGGLCCLMAVGYLNLSDNCIPPSALRPLARTHILELCLGSGGRSAEERRGILGILPNVWVLDGEYVTAQERSDADGSCGGSDPRGNGEEWDDLTRLTRKPENRCPRGGGAAGGRNRQQTGGGGGGGGNHDGTGQQEFRDLCRQGRQTKEFFENVVWKLPCRTGAADPFRLATLIERYDQRAAASNKSAWLGSFTRKNGGARCTRRGWSLPLPRPHSEALLSLPLELKLDVAVLLTVRAAFRETIPQQILAEAFMVLLVKQKGLPEGIHSDLSRVPPYICTALAHVLRSSILVSVHQVSEQGCADTTAPPLLDRVEMDLLDAIPPVATGVENAIDEWETSRNSPGRDTKSDPCAAIHEWETYQAAPERDKNSDRCGGVEVAEELSQRLTESRGGEGCDSMLSIDLGSVSGTSEQPRLPCGSDLDDLSTKEDYRSEETGALPTKEHYRLKETGGLAWAAEARVPVTGTFPERRLDPPETPLDGGRRGAGGGLADDESLLTHKPMPSVRLTRLCRRAVILLTRSPACPDLVERQTEPANQRTYDQMGPLLARAHMSFRDLHPDMPFGGNIGDNSATRVTREPHVDPVGGDSLRPPRAPSPATPGECSGAEGLDYGCGGEGDVNEVGLPDASSWCTTARSPKAGERVQVLHDLWSVILDADADTSCVVVAPFQGVQGPPYNGNSRVDARDLFYDPRGWWKHAHSLKTNAPVQPGRLHRLSRGLSSSGLPRGAGSLNEALDGSGRQEVPGADGRRLDGRSGSSADLPDPSIEPETQLLGPSKGSDDKGGSTSHPSRAVALSGSDVTPLTPTASSRCTKGVVGIFSAEGSWDPAFVVAPGRLVALQNKAAARRRGARRARQVAWHRIDGPEASVAPRPMMPRCFYSATAIDGPTCTQVHSSTSIPGLDKSKLGHDTRSPPRLTEAAAPYHGGRNPARHGSDTLGGRASRSVSPPPSRAADSSATAGQASAINAWLALQREMGSMKADNRLRSRGSIRGASAASALSQGTQGSTVSLRNKTPAGNSSDGNCADTASGALAKHSSSRQVYLPTPARREASEESSTAVFELTQVDGGQHHAGDATSATTAAAATATASALATPSCATPTPTPTAEEITQTTTGEPRTALAGSEGRGGGHQTPTDDERSRWRREKRRKSGRVGAADFSAGCSNNSSTSATSAGSTRGAVTKTTTARWKWKPCAYRSPEWFNVPARNLFLVDPSSVATVSRPTAAAAATAVAAAAAATRATGVSSGVDIRSTGHKLEGDGSGGSGSGVSGVGGVGVGVGGVGVGVGVGGGGVGVGGVGVGVGVGGGGVGSGSGGGGGGGDGGGGGGGGDGAGESGSGDDRHSFPCRGHGYHRGGAPQRKGVGQPKKEAGGREAARDAGCERVSTPPKTFPPAAVLVRLPLYSTTESMSGVGSGSRGNLDSCGPHTPMHGLSVSSQISAGLGVTLPKLRPVISVEPTQERSESEALVPGGNLKEPCRGSPSLLVGGGVIRSVTPERGRGPTPALSPNERRRDCGGSSMDSLSSLERPRLIVTPQRPTLQFRAPYVAGVSLSTPDASKRNISPCITPSCVRRVPPPLASRGLSAPVSVPDREEDDKTLGRGIASARARGHSANVESAETRTLSDRFKRGKTASSRAAGARHCGGGPQSAASLGSDSDSSLAALLYAPPAPQSQGDDVPSTAAKKVVSTDSDECCSINSTNSLLCEWNRPAVSSKVTDETVGKCDHHTVSQ